MFLCYLKCLLHTLFGNTYLENSFKLVLFSVKSCSKFPECSELTISVDYFRAQAANSKASFNTDDMANHFRKEFSLYSHSLMISQQVSGQIPCQ